MSMSAAGKNDKAVRASKVWTGTAYTVPALEDVEVTKGKFWAAAQPHANSRSPAMSHLSSFKWGCFMRPSFQTRG
jgi:hypothetical protein